MTEVKTRWRRLALSGVLCIGLTACGGGAASTALLPAPVSSPSTSDGGPAVPSGASATGGPAEASPASAESQPADVTQAPDVGGGATSGDVPDNAVFLTYRQASLGFSIQYVEGWQVATQPGGVVIHDKDSSETVSVGQLPSDVAAYVASADLPALQTQAGYKFVKQDTIKVGASNYRHVVYHVLSPVDPVTNKRVPSTVDRYYVPGPSRLAIVSLSTPDGVDNVDAFRQVIESFAWG